MRKICFTILICTFFDNVHSASALAYSRNTILTQKIQEVFLQSAAVNIGNRKNYIAEF